MLADKIIETLPIAGVIAVVVYGFFTLVIIIFELIGRWTEK